MVSIGWSIFIGVISGVMTSALIWLAAKFFQNVIKPEIQAITYQGVKIDGTWVGLYESVSPMFKQSVDDPPYTIYIEQKGHSVKGELLRNKDRNGTRDVKAFVFTGLFKDKSLVLWYKPKDETRLGSGSYVMRLVADGKRLEGKSLYISSGDGSVAEFSVSWEKKA